MLAFVYLFVMFLLGDSICRRFYPFLSAAHRLAGAFLAGLVLSSWWTYLSALLFSSTSSPMLWGNIVFFITAIAAIVWLRKVPLKEESLRNFDRSTTEFRGWDWVIVRIFLIFASWMMFSTLNMEGDYLEIGHHEFPDFGSTLSIMQSFALGHNF